MPTATHTDRLSDAQVEQFHRDGFLNAGMVLSEEESRNSPMPWPR